MVVVAPEFCAQEDVFPGYATFLDPESDLLFDVVDSCRVDQSHAFFEGLADAVFLGVGVLKCSEPEGRDFGSRVESVGCCAGGEGADGGLMQGVEGFAERRSGYVGSGHGGLVGWLSIGLVDGRDRSSRIGTGLRCMVFALVVSYNSFAGLNAHLERGLVGMRVPVSVSGTRDGACQG